MRHKVLLQQTGAYVKDGMAAAIRFLITLTKQVSIPVDR
ncbi:hypothetical protein QF028_002878 [Neobacillus sp. B4I6]